MKLTNGCCCYSTSLHGAYNSMYNGKWSRGSLSGESASPTTTKDKAFAYYKSGVTSSYYGYFTWVSGDKWEERRLSDDKVLYHFRLLSEAAGATILFDEERGLYVRLTNSDCYLSYKSDDINEKKYDGAWVTFDYGYSLTLVLELDISFSCHT